MKIDLVWFSSQFQFLGTAKLINRTNEYNCSLNILFHPPLSLNFISVQLLSIFAYTSFLLAKYASITKLQNIESRNHKSHILAFPELQLLLSVTNVDLSIVILIWYGLLLRVQVLFVNFHIFFYLFCFFFFNKFLLVLLQIKIVLMCV